VSRSTLCDLPRTSSLARDNEFASTAPPVAPPVRDTVTMTPTVERPAFTIEILEL